MSLPRCWALSAPLPAFSLCALCERDSLWSPSLDPPCSDDREFPALGTVHMGCPPFFSFTFVSLLFPYQASLGAMHK